MPKLQQMIEAAYTHPEVRQAILDEVQKLEEQFPGHVARIERGELTLPSEHDAARHVSGFAEQEQAKHWQEVGREGAPQHNSRKHAEASLKLDEYLGLGA